MGLMSKSIQQNANVGKLVCEECNKIINGTPRLLFRNGRVIPVCKECCKKPEIICFECKKKIDASGKYFIAFTKDYEMISICKECSKKEKFKLIS